MKKAQLEIFDLLKKPMKSLGKLPTDIWTDREFAIVELWRAFREAGVSFSKPIKGGIYENTLPNGKTVKDLLPYVESVIKDRIKSIKVVDFLPSEKGLLITTPVDDRKYMYQIVFNNNSGMTLNPVLLADIAYKIQGDEAVKPLKKKLENPNEISPQNTEFMKLMGAFTDKKALYKSCIFFAENQVFALDGPTLVTFNHSNSISDFGLYSLENNTWSKYNDADVLRSYENIATQINDFTLRNAKEFTSLKINRETLVNTLKQIAKQFKNKEFSERNFGGKPEIIVEVYPGDNPRKSKMILTMSNVDYGTVIDFTLDCNYTGKAFIKTINPVLLLKAIDTFKGKNEFVEIILNDKKNCIAIHDKCKYGSYETLLMYYSEKRYKETVRKTEKDKNGKIVFIASEYLDVYLPKKEAIAKFNESYTPVQIDEKVRLIALKYKYAALAQQQELELLS